MSQEPELLIGIYIPGFIANREDLTRTEKYVYGIVNGLSQKHGHCYASNYYLAQKAGCSEKTITNTVSKIKDLGLWKVEVLVFDKSSNPEARLLGTKRYIYPFQLEEISRGVETSCEGGGHTLRGGVATSCEESSQCIASIDKKNKEEVLKGGVEGNLNTIREATASPNLSPEYKQLIQKKQERKANKKSKYKKKPVRKQFPLDRDEGLEISLLDNVGLEEVQELMKKHKIRESDVIKAKEDYINWVKGSSYDPKVWGKDMKIYVDKFCSQIASKKKDKPKDMYEEIKELYGV
jgi:DNA-binding Lrp family transcriptional regulator